MAKVLLVETYCKVAAVINLSGRLVYVFRVSTICEWLVYIYMMTFVYLSHVAGT